AMSGLEPSSIVFPLRRVFQKKSNVFIRVAEVESVDTELKEIQTNLGALSYDYLVLAIGADTNFFGNQQVAQNAIPMKSVSEALFLRNAILKDYERSVTTLDYDKRQWLIDIVVVGGGPTGVEVSGALAEMRNYVLPKDYSELDIKEIDIYLLQGGDQLLYGMSDKASLKAKEFLEKLGVQVKLNTRVTDYDGRYVYTNTGEKILAKKVIWAAGIIGNKIQGMPQDCLVRGNRIKVDAFNRVEGLQDVFAIGDIAYQEEEKYPTGHPQVAQVAIQHAKRLANNLKRWQAGTEPKPFAYKDLGSMATIGRHLAVVDMPRYSIQGAFAWLIWLFVHLFKLVGIKNRLFVFLNWLWNYFTYDQSLRLIIRPRIKSRHRELEEVEKEK
ncbi:MAG: FAD-dependent oxidoreductase, partial [Phaeodactylibacter sp.]|nr:FAD-dependent oxidoreductase [Phaeodactylibacter sp.]